MAEHLTGIHKARILILILSPAHITHACTHVHMHRRGATQANRDPFSFPGSLDPLIFNMHRRATQTNRDPFSCTVRCGNLSGEIRINYHQSYSNQQCILTVKKSREDYGRRPCDVEWRREGCRRKFQITSEVETLSTCEKIRDLRELWPREQTFSQSNERNWWEEKWRRRWTSGVER